MKATNNWLSMLSARVSWGKVGNQPGQDYLYESKYGSTDRYLDMAAMRPLNIRLTDLRWETKATWDIGMDLGLWNDKLVFALEWYDARRQIC